MKVAGWIERRSRACVSAVGLRLVFCVLTISDVWADAAWRLVRSPDQSGAVNPALMQVADFDRSDPGIAGVMVRCDHASLETVIIVLDPLPPRSSATVSLTVGTDTRSFEAATIPTGAGLRIPFDPGAALETAWSGQTDLRIDVVYSDHSARATFDLSGLQEGLSALRQECLTNR